MTVGKVITEASMSLDGFIAKQDNTIGRLFDWLQNGDLEIPTPAKDFSVHLTPQTAEHWRRWTSQLGPWWSEEHCLTSSTAGMDDTLWTCQWWS